MAGARAVEPGPAGGGRAWAGPARSTGGDFRSDMNRNLAIVLLVVIAGFSAAGIVGYRHASEAQAQAAKEIAALRLKNEALERAGWIRNNPDADAYRNDIKGYLRWYFEQVSSQQ